MIRALIIAAALGCAAPASAMTFCISEQLSTDAAPTSFCQTTSDANGAYFIMAMNAVYFPNAIVVTAASDGTAAVTRAATLAEIQSGAPGAPTIQQIVNAAGAGIWTGEVANVNSYLRAQAAAAAAAAAPSVQ